MALKVRPMAAHQVLSYHDYVACVTHGRSVSSCGLSTDSLSPFSKVGTAMIRFHTDLLGLIVKLRSTNTKYRPRGVDKESQSVLLFPQWNLNVW